MKINCNDLSDKELAQLCIKYEIIQQHAFKNHTRKEVILKIEEWGKLKIDKYKSRSLNYVQSRQRRMFTQGAT